jgi:exosortase/archaeosortase family protein
MRDRYWSAERGGYIDPTQPAQTPVFRRGAAAARVLAFAAIFAVLQQVWDALRGGAIERFIVHDLTLLPAARIIDLFNPQIHVVTREFSLRAPGGGLNILNGCEGVDILFLVVAAVLVSPVSVSSRMLGLACGIPVVFALNQLRIIALFHAYRFDAGLFDTLHGAVVPIVVIMLVAACFYAWLKHAK